MGKIALRCCIFALLVVIAGTLRAQDAPGYPSKPIRIVIALAPGGDVDTFGRMLGQLFTETWGTAGRCGKPHRNTRHDRHRAHRPRAAPDAYTLRMTGDKNACSQARCIGPRRSA
jgi:hypothetical protein